jgi:hypothetical protein
VLLDSRGGSIVGSQNIKEDLSSALRIAVIGVDWASGSGTRLSSAANCAPVLHAVRGDLTVTGSETAVVLTEHRAAVALSVLGAPHVHVIASGLRIMNNR